MRKLFLAAELSFTMDDIFFPFLKMKHVQYILMHNNYVFKGPVMNSPSNLSESLSELLCVLSEL